MCLPEDYAAGTSSTSRQGLSEQGMHRPCSQYTTPQDTQLEPTLCCVLQCKNMAEPPPAAPEMEAGGGGCCPAQHPCTGQPREGDGPRYRVWGCDGRHQPLLAGPPLRTHTRAQRGTRTSWAGSRATATANACAARWKHWE